MAFWNRPWTYTSGGRTLTVKGWQKLKDWSAARKVLIKEFTEAKELQDLTILFTKRISGGASTVKGRVTIKDMLAGRHRLMLHPECEDLAPLLRHELEHCLHAQRGALRDEIKVKERLGRRAKRLLFKEIRRLKPILNRARYAERYSLIVLRTLLAAFFRGCYAEGLARVSENAHNENNYEEAKKYTEYVRDAFARGHLQNGRLTERISQLFAIEDISSGVMYSVGNHMALTLIASGVQLTAIERMRMPDFIKAYERVEKRRPVLSWKSGKGIVDYKQTLDALTRHWKATERKQR